jgi:hypothetical protein
MSTHAQNPARRALFAGLAVMPAAAIAVPAQAVSLAALAPKSPDAELVALGARWEIALEAFTEAYKRENQIEETVAAIPIPDSLRVQPAMGRDWAIGLPIQHGGTYYGLSALRAAEDAARAHRQLFESNGFNQCMMERCEEVRDALLKLRDDRAAMGERLGYKAAEQETSRLDFEVVRLETAILAIRATTPDGFRVKAKLVAHLYPVPAPRDGEPHDDAVLSLLSDLAAA